MQAETTQTVSNTNPPHKRPRPWLKRTVYVLLLILLVFGVFRLVARQRLANRITALHDAGYPTTLKEVDAWYPAPQDANAADVYGRAFELYDKEFDTNKLPIVGSAYLPPPGARLPQTMVEDARAYFDVHAEAIAKLEDATQIDACRFPIDMTEGVHLKLPHLGDLRRGARLLHLSAVLEADAGDTDKAVARVGQIVRIADALKNEPTVISALVSLSIRKIGVDLAERLVATGTLRDQQLARLADVLSGADDVRLIKRGVVTEACSGLALCGDTQTLIDLDLLTSMNNYQEPKTGPARAWAYTTVVARRVSGVMDLDAAWMLDTAMFHLSQPDTLTTRDPSERTIPRLYIVSEAHFGGTQPLYRTLRRQQAQRLVAQTGIAAERYHLKHGTLPGRLPDLAPGFLNEVPVDPMDGQPLRYRVEEGGAIIYSIGQDGVDDGGRERITRTNSAGETYHDEPDITFTFGDLQEKLWPSEEKSESNKQSSADQ